MALFDPQKIFEALEAAAEEYAGTLTTWRQLERLEKPLLSRLQMGFEGSVANREMEARASTEYRTHIDGMVVAETAYIRARARYENFKILAELRRTEESTRRYLTK